MTANQLGIGSVGIVEISTRFIFNFAPLHGFRRNDRTPLPLEFHQSICYLKLKRIYRAAYFILV